MIKLNFEKEGYKIVNNNPFDMKKTFFDKNFDFLYDEYRNFNWKNVAVLNKEDISKYSNINKILDQIYLILKYSQIANVRFEDLWLVESSEEYYKKNELPYVPHIDKERFFKVMIYLDEVNQSNGPLCFYNDIPKNYEKLRLSLPKDYKLKKLNVLNDLDLNKFIACTGSFGTSIFFDTNTPHFASETQKYNKRKVLRFNFKFLDL